MADTINQRLASLDAKLKAIQKEIIEVEWEKVGDGLAFRGKQKEERVIEDLRVQADRVRLEMTRLTHELLHSAGFRADGSKRGRKIPGL